MSNLAPQKTESHNNPSQEAVSDIENVVHFKYPTVELFTSIRMLYPNIFSDKSLTDIEIYK